MRVYYPVVIDKEGDTYGATAPDFPGCVSSGKSAEEALAGITEALAGHVALMVEDRDPIPDPTPIEAVEDDPDVVEICRALVPVLLPGKVGRYNVTLDEDLVHEIDATVGKGGRSRFLATAARVALLSQRNQPPAGE